LGATAGIDNKISLSLLLLLLLTHPSATGAGCKAQGKTVMCSRFTLKIQRQPNLDCYTVVKSKPYGPKRVKYFFILLQ
jgi:hypothetical protein